ncbi:hypothetical protein ACH5RR_039142 [Cinchona calisaya]|uniref:Transposase n=1 Tax=Cinchona calisaya TaxID=153742 RepID=A0ABD2Y0V0_9GENT
MQVEHNQRTNNMQFFEKVRTLARGPSLEGLRINTHCVNSFHFRTKSYEMGKVNQNSGVTVSYASCRDKNLVVGSVTYDGIQVDDNIWVREGAEAMTLDTDEVNNHTGNDQHMEDVDNTISKATIEEEPVVQPLPAQRHPPIRANPNPDEVGSDILGGKTYSLGKHGMLAASKSGSSNVGRVSSVLKGNSATNSSRLSVST